MNLSTAQRSMSILSLGFRGTLSWIRKSARFRPLAHRTAMDGQVSKEIETDPI